MSKDTYEAYIVMLGQRHGKRHVVRKYLNVPVDFATGDLDRLSDLQIREALNDFLAEQERRDEVDA